MIYPDHKKWADLVFRLYVYRLLKRHFYALYIAGPTPDFNPGKPLLILPNHSSWWDGFFIYLLNNEVIHRKIHLMMLEEQLKKNSFFRHLGAYSIRPGSLADVRESINYTVSLLNDKQLNPLVCMFPQGQLLPWHKRPVVFRKGLEYILKGIHIDINLYFLSIRVESLGEQRSEVFMRMSDVINIYPGMDLSIDELVTGFTSSLDDLENRITGNEKGRILLQGKRSVNDWFQEYLHKRK